MQLEMMQDVDMHAYMHGPSSVGALLQELPHARVREPVQTKVALRSMQLLKSLTRMQL